MLLYINNSIMIYNLPIDILDNIFEFTDYKSDIQKYFKQNIAPKIDISLKEISNNCELCYIKQFKNKKNNNYKCLVHSIIGDQKNKKCYFSLYNLPNGKTNKTLGRLFLAINNIEYFINILSNTTGDNRHKLSEIHNELLLLRN